MMSDLLTISITYDPIRITGRFECEVGKVSSIWDRLKTRAFGISSDTTVTDNKIELPWSDVLGIIREFGTKQCQQTYNFRFVPTTEATQRIQQFLQEVRSARAAQNKLTIKLTQSEIISDLKKKGFVKRNLKSFQLRDVERLLSLPHGANFSVPGAGKTTVTLALHLLTRKEGHHLVVVGPKSSFPAWGCVMSECLDPDIAGDNAEPFTMLDGRADELNSLLSSGATRFIISYDLMVRQQSLLTNYFSRQPVHLILDEAHRMKAGLASQRGTFLLSIANLPVRRDILTGTPMPQGPEDLASQLAFLWPGLGLDSQIRRGASPRQTLGNLYVRTTKQELGLPPAKRYFYQVEMAPGQLALYAIVRDEALRQLSVALKIGGNNLNIIGARRSVMRLLQLSANPILALQGMSSNVVGMKSGLVDEVLKEGPSLKMQRVANHARNLAASGKKCVIWTIFTDTISELERMLADLNPVCLYGAVPTGEPNEGDTREGRLKRFHEDPRCQVMIANPAAAGEGISLHMVCHDAIYLDRSYVSTHYLQSIDRIHRLGLPPDTQTNIHIYQTKAPAGLGSIDLSVSRRLANKLRNLQQLLDDPDLHEVALDEENADDPVDYDVELQDLVDLVEELEGRGQDQDEAEA